MVRPVMLAVLLAGLVAVARPGAQSNAATQPAASPATARLQGPRDVTGYWVSIVSEDWHYRMVTPRKGDYESVPLNDDGQRIGNAWDPKKDAARGLACAAYGAAAIMRVPGRVRLSWEDDWTLKLEADAGTQTAPIAASGQDSLSGAKSGGGSGTSARCSSSARMAASVAASPLSPA